MCKDQSFACHLDRRHVQVTWGSGPGTAVEQQNRTQLGTQ